MVGNSQRRGLSPVKWLVFTLVCLTIAVYIPFKFFAFAADTLPNSDSAKATKFQFARMRYPGGTPEYIKNWYTDYPAMDQHLTMLLQRLTGIDVAPSVLIDPSSRDILKYPLVYSVEPEQMVLGSHEIENLRNYLSRGGIWFATGAFGYGVVRYLNDAGNIVKAMEQWMGGIQFNRCCSGQDALNLFQKLIEFLITVKISGEQWENGPSGRIPKVFAVVDPNGVFNFLLVWY